MPEQHLELEHGDPKWFEQYAGQSTAELLALEETHRIDSLVLAFEQGIYQRASTVGFDPLTETEVSILAVEALEREVNNGGYAQFFVNDSAAFTPVIFDALNRIGVRRPPRSRHVPSLRSAWWAMQTRSKFSPPSTVSIPIAIVSWRSSFSKTDGHDVSQATPDRR